MEEEEEQDQGLEPPLHDKLMQTLASLKDVPIQTIAVNIGRAIKTAAEKGTLDVYETSPASTAKYGLNIRLTVEEVFGEGDAGKANEDLFVSRKRMKWAAVERELLDLLESEGELPCVYQATIFQSFQDASEDDVQPYVSVTVYWGTKLNKRNREQDLKEVTKEEEEEEKEEEKEENQDVLITIRVPSNKKICVARR